MATYYVTRRGDTFDLRQERFRRQFESGNEHPHDVCATGFSREGLLEVIEKYKFDADTTALED